jgi:quinol monooxygenase YgiN
VSAHALVVEIRAHPGQKAALLARLRQHRDNVLAKEPGCQYFDLLEVEGDEDTLFLYEVYEDAAALEAHAQTEHFQAYRSDTDPMIAERRRMACTLANG